MLTAPAGSQLVKDRVQWLHIPVCRDPNVFDTACERLMMMSTRALPPATAALEGEGEEKDFRPLPRHLFTLLPAQDPALLRYAADVYRNSDCDVEEAVARVVDTLASDFRSDFQRYLATASTSVQRDTLALSCGGGTLDESNEAFVHRSGGVLLNPPSMGYNSSSSINSSIMSSHVVVLEESRRWSLASPALANAVRSQFDAHGRFSETDQSVIAGALSRGRRREFIRRLSCGVLTSRWNGEDTEAKRELRGEVEATLRDHFRTAGVAPVSRDAAEFLDHPMVAALARHRSNSGVVKWLMSPRNAGRDMLLSAGQPCAKYLELLRNRIVKYEDRVSRVSDRAREEEELDRLLPPEFPRFVESLRANDRLREGWARLGLM